MNDTTQNLGAPEQKFGSPAMMSETLHKLRTLVDDLQGNALHKARDAARSTDQVVHHHPYSAIGIAAAVGLVIGFLATRR